MLEIIWCHIRACMRDIRAYRLGDLTASRRAGGQFYVGNEHKEWRMR